MEEAAPVRPRRRIALATSIALASCNQVYDLGDTELIPPADTDGDDDGIEDVLDVCPDDPDPAQRDDDADGLGDVCDNCPLHPNTRQVDTDRDSVGDVCDPHAATPGDCIVLYDSFSDDESLAARWEIVATPPSVVMLANSRLSVMPASGETVTMRALGFTGAFDVQTIGTSVVLGASKQVGVLANASPLELGDSCSLIGYSADAAPYLDVKTRTMDGVVASTSGLYSLPAGYGFDLRMSALASDGQRGLRCRVEYGYTIAAVKQLALGNSLMPPPGPPGLTTNVALELEGFVAYQFTAGGVSCPVKETR